MSQASELAVAEEYEYVMLGEGAEFRSAEKVEEGMALGRLGGIGLERDHSEYFLLMAAQYGKNCFIFRYHRIGNAYV